MYTDGFSDLFCDGSERGSCCLMEVVSFSHLSEVVSTAIYLCDVLSATDSSLAALNNRRGGRGICCAMYDAALSHSLLLPEVGPHHIQRVMSPLQ
ncbi:hypothetical protein PR048_033053 [Dryococelus australis]|uniref:Uncharacterized protein n=1 Tax=Dryococelus australis TaxID=614101 RepID=A0ABQ9G038_9NEOP|nr:hypothetical protein PR048_033053 [Dryococelus australis]